MESQPKASTADLVKEALVEAKELVRLEVALAQNEMKQELVELKRAAVVFGAAASLALVGLTMLVVAVCTAIAPIGASLVVGIVLLTVGAVLAGIGARRLPKKPMHRTRRRLETDVKLMKERVA
jgi:uncharacterized membrane protein YqjE